jgi:hypothetical protein
VSPAIDATVLRSMNKDPGQRPASAKAFLELLRQAVELGDSN